MTNAALKEIIKEYGSRINYIMLDNDRFLLTNYSANTVRTTRGPHETLKIDDIEYKTFGGIDMFAYPATDRMQMDLVKYRVWHKTECIQEIGIVDEGYEKYRVLPHNFA